MIVIGSGSQYPIETNMTSLNSAGSTGETRTYSFYFSPPPTRPYIGVTSTQPFFFTLARDTLYSNVTLPVLSMLNSRVTHSQKRTSPNSIRLVLRRQLMSDESPRRFTSYSGPPSTWHMACVLKRCPPIALYTNSTCSSLPGSSAPLRGSISNISLIGTLLLFKRILSRLKPMALL